MKKRQLTLLIFLQAIATTITHAQSLPNKQLVSLRAPADIKIDGRATEWGNKFEAYNKVSRVFYTVSNDDSNIYLTLGTKDQFGTEKVIMGGVTFMIMPLAIANDNKQSLNKISVSYPTLADNRKTEEIADLSRTASRYTGDTIIKKRKTDSLCLLANKKIEMLFKEINISGIREIGDKTISIYNENGIRLKAQFNNKMSYFYELAIPLKYLARYANGDKFKYNIRLNGMPDVASNGVGKVHFADPMAVLSPDGIYMDNPTDFWGEYTLAKK